MALQQFQKLQFANKKRAQYGIGDLMSAIIHRHHLNGKMYLPRLSFFIILDVLLTIHYFGPQDFRELLERVRTLHKHNSLATYLDSLVEAGLVVKREVDYRGAVPSSFVFELSEKGTAIADIFTG